VFQRRGLSDQSYHGKQISVDQRNDNRLRTISGPTTCLLFIPPTHAADRLCYTAQRLVHRARRLFILGRGDANSNCFLSFFCDTLSERVGSGDLTSIHYQRLESSESIVRSNTIPYILTSVRAPRVALPGQTTDQKCLIPGAGVRSKSLDSLLRECWTGTAIFLIRSSFPRESSQPW